MPYYGKHTHRRTNMTKNAFEIRLELLKMAKEMMDRQYDELSSAYWTAVNSAVEQTNKTVETVLEETSKIKPQMYSPNEIMEKANELYSFINKKD